MSAMRDSKGRFVSGHGASNTGRTLFKKGCVPPPTAFKKGNEPWNKGVKMPEMTGENHPRWKGGTRTMKGYGTFYKKQYKHRKRNAVGNHTKQEWGDMKQLYNFTCPGCLRKEPEILLTEDHIVPLSKGGDNTIKNIQPLCRSCNSRKLNYLIPKYEFQSAT